jgi:hypothetical protein
MQLLLYVVWLSLCVVHGSTGNSALLRREPSKAGGFKESGIRAHRNGENSETGRKRVSNFVSTLHAGVTKGYKRLGVDVKKHQLRSNSTVLAGIFCYAVVRRHSPTIPILSRHLRRACDGWSLYGSFNDPRYGVVKAYSQENERKAIKAQMHEMMVGVWSDIAHRRFLAKYKWFVKVDDDCYVRPGMLRKGLARYGDDAIVSVWQDDDEREPDMSDGFFVAVPHGLIVSLVKELNRGPSTCDQVLSGHDESLRGTREPPGCDLQINVVGFLDQHGNNLVVGDTCVDLQGFASHDFKNGGLFCPSQSCQKGRRRCISNEFAIAHGGDLKWASTWRAFSLAFDSPR